MTLPGPVLVERLQEEYAALVAKTVVCQAVIAELKSGNYTGLGPERLQELLSRHEVEKRLWDTVAKQLIAYAAELEAHRRQTMLPQQPQPVSDPLANCVDLSETELLADVKLLRRKLPTDVHAAQRLAENQYEALIRLAQHVPSLDKAPIWKQELHRAHEGLEKVLPTLDKIEADLMRLRDDSEQANTPTRSLFASVWQKVLWIRNSLALFHPGQSETLPAALVQVRALVQVSFAEVTHDLSTFAYSDGRMQSEVQEIIRHLTRLKGEVVLAQKLKQLSVEL